jgi:hypothetical protein
MTEKRDRKPLTIGTTLYAEIRGLARLQQTAGIESIIPPMASGISDSR